MAHPVHVDMRLFVSQEIADNRRQFVRRGRVRRSGANRARRRRWKTPSQLSERPIVSAKVRNGIATRLTARAVWLFKSFPPRDFLPGHSTSQAAKGEEVLNLAGGKSTPLAAGSAG
jgi:hypothetical protein